MKKRVIALALALVMALGLTACGSNPKGAMDAANQNSFGDDSGLPVVKWKMISTWGSGNVHFTVDQRFSELVSQMTNGRFQITNYAEGELCAANQVFDYVKDGTVQAGGDWAGYWAGKDTTFELLSTTMDVLTGMDYYVWINQGGGLECFQDMYGQYGMTYFPITVHMSESGIRSSKPITSIKDLQTMKTRLGGVMAGRVGQKLGFNITTVAASELYESLQRGVIDAGEFSGPNADSTLKLQEVAKYWCEPAWYQSAGNNGVMINKEAWDELPEEYQQVVATAAATCRGEQIARYTWLDCNAANKMLNEEGVTVTRMNDEDLALIRQTCKEVYEAEAAANPNFKKVYDSMLAYREVVDPYREMLGDYGWGFSYGE